MDRPRLKNVILWAIGRQKRFVISGPSMLPTLKPGDQVLVDVKSHLRRPIRASEIVLFKQPSGDLIMVKRVHSVVEDAVHVRGDNVDESSDSRHFGQVPIGNVIGIVCAKITS